ncbi:MAG: OadG family transporter subunit, partial [Bacillota bacterium]
MIPDTIGGAFTLTLVNLLVVFVVLILVALMISLIYKIVSSFQKETHTEIEGTEVQGEGYVEVGGVGVMEIRPEAVEVVTS